jgi:hypothetical protein
MPGAPIRQMNLIMANSLHDHTPLVMFFDVLEEMLSLIVHRQYLYKEKS